jgi:dGTPase
LLRVTATRDRGHRSQFQQDHDRILFSTPVRRLSDKTQVFPLDNNDGVRTRLTHSHEVANISRSIGARLIARGHRFSDDPNLDVLPILAAIGLSHDIGNPPFGHRGEAAIGDWFYARQDWIFSDFSKGDVPLPEPVDTDLRSEFLKFDGNPQSLRLLTHLQTSIGNAGLDLTAATLAALMKYPVSVTNVRRTTAADKKFGYFASEQAVVQWITECASKLRGLAIIASANILAADRAGALHQSMQYSLRLNSGDPPQHSPPHGPRLPPSGSQTAPPAA